jgi:F-type H+-transporting ATPase subunit alpha
LADIDIKDVARFNDGLVKYVEDKAPYIITSIKEHKELKADTEDELRKAIEDYKTWFKV